jgi:hypothetical protein
MSFAFPSDFAAQVGNLIRGFGENAVFTAEGAAPVALRVSVQSPTAEQLAAEIDQTALIIYVAAADLPTPPRKFDRITVRGQDRAIEEVHQEVADGATQAWWLVVAG